MLNKEKNAYVRVENVSKTFKSGSIFNRSETKAVSDLSLTVTAGQTLGIVGESGSGKSTLGRMIVGLHGIDSGKIIVDGRPVKKGDSRTMRQHWRNAQMVFQDPHSSLNPTLTIRETLLEPLYNFDIARGAKAEALIKETIDACGLPTSALERYPRAFSGGQRQRIGIARALIVRPKLIVADEPVSALDVSVQAQIVNLMQDLKAEFGLTYIFIGHDLSVVQHVSDKIAVMYRGRLVEIGATQEVYGAPRHPYTDLLLSSIPIPDVEAEKQRLSHVRELKRINSGTPTTGCNFAGRCPHKSEDCTGSIPTLDEAELGHSAACFNQLRHNPPKNVHK